MGSLEKPRHASHLAGDDSHFNDLQYSLLDTELVVLIRMCVCVCVCV